jgi:outer membrane protein assembly factor BamB
VHNDIVFVGSDYDKIHALNASTGETIWEYTAGDEIPSSPAVAYGRVYVGCQDRKFYCLSETDGSHLWAFPTGGYIYSSPCVTENKVVFGSNDDRVYCLDATTGHHLWNFSTSGDVRSSPAVADGKVFFGSLDMKVYALNLADGSLVWRYTTSSSITTSPSVVESKLFISSFKTLYCLDVSDGSLIWSYIRDAAIHSSPAVAGDNVYIGCNDYKMYCLSSVNGESKWNFTTGDIIYSSPAIADGKVFFGSNDDKVYCLDATTGTLIWSYDTGGDIRTSSPAVANKVVFIASSYTNPFRGILFAFGPANTQPVASNLTINPSSPVTIDDLTGSYNYFDEDGDPENGTEIRWYKDDELQPALDDTLDVSSALTSKGEVWCFTVRPKDGKDFGKLQISPSITIQNSPPIIDSFTPVETNPEVYENSTLTFTHTSSDPDGDLITYSWLLDGFEKADTQNWIYMLDFESAGIHNVTLTVFDGELPDTQQWNVTVVNVNRSPTIDSYHPQTDPTIAEGESQEFNITKSDADLDSLAVTWYLNGTKLDESSDSYTYIAGFWSAGTHNVTVAVSDNSSKTQHEWALTVMNVERDVGVTHVRPSKTIVGEGNPVYYIVRVENQGNYTESLNITLYANTSIINQTDVTLVVGNSTTLNFTWNTTGWAKGNYTMTVNATILPGEIDLADNTFTDGWIIVTIPGDVDGDSDVDIYDIVSICVGYDSKKGNPRYAPNCDIDCDGDIDIYDVVTASTNYGEKYP